MEDHKYPCLLIAGEKSGEDHALSFIPGLKEKLPNLNLFGVGGDSLKKIGMELLYHLKDFSSFGFSEVLGQIPFYLKAYYKIIHEVKKRNCRVAILIDFQTFNLKLATQLKKEGVTVLYYVAPQAWVWKSYRTKILEKTVHTLFTIIPFEKKWFEDRGVSRVQSVPHPLLINYRDKLDGFKQNRSTTFKADFSKELKILLLPGSRKFEVRYMLPIYIEVVRALRKIKNIKSSIVISPSVPPSYYASYLGDIDKIYTNENLPEALIEADFSIASSGTVTLACALFEVPSIVCYKGSFINELIYNYFIRYEGFVSLANIVHNAQVFPELLQKRCDTHNILAALLGWINDVNEYNNVKMRLSHTSNLLSGELRDVSSYMESIIKNVYK